MENIPVYIHFSAVALGAVGTAFGFYKAGIAKGEKKNGYVTRSDCKINVNGMISSIDSLRDKMMDSDGELHDKINLANIGIGKIQGYLSGKKE